MGITGLFLFIFSLFKHNFTTKGEKVLPVAYAGIRNHNLLNMSLLASPLDQGSRPTHSLTR